MVLGVVKVQNMDFTSTMFLHIKCINFCRHNIVMLCLQKLIYSSMRILFACLNHLLLVFFLILTLHMRAQLRLRSICGMIQIWNSFPHFTVLHF